jgi:hypothetical protein
LTEFMFNSTIFFRNTKEASDWSPCSIKYYILMI